MIRNKEAMGDSMTIYWIKTASSQAFDTLTALETALERGDRGTPPAQANPVEEQDAYLVENVAHAHERWSIDQQAIVISQHPRLARGIHGFQHMVRRMAWWHTAPQWQQISAWNAAIVRIIDVLLDRQRLLGLRIANLERTNMAMHVYALEQQIQALRDEQRQLRQRIAELEK